MSNEQKESPPDSRDELSNNVKSSTDPKYIPIYCEICLMWLNGEDQMKDHKIGKKHKKNYELLIARRMALMFG